MTKRLFRAAPLLALALAAALALPGRADNYVLDDAHTAASFNIAHLGLSWTHGRFDDVAGTFTIDAADPGKSSFTLTIKADSVDTNNKKRDEHLRSPDFFNVKQFPTIRFESTSVKPADGGYQVTGNLTLHGVTKPISFLLKGGKTAELMGKKRMGFWMDTTLKRSEFGMDKMVGPVGDEVILTISFEGVKQ
ncbi:MAG TPA: YceI family protein [Gemmataceae bacterium]|nr:YceI family protein [Gemmataceae bacterium]